MRTGKGEVLAWNESGALIPAQAPPRGSCGAAGVWLARARVFIDAPHPSRRRTSDEFLIGGPPDRLLDALEGRPDSGGPSEKAAEVSRLAGARSRRLAADGAERRIGPSGGCRSLLARS